MTNALPLLKAVRARIEKPEAWTQIFYAQRADGRGTHVLDDRATRWSLVGAADAEALVLDRRAWLIATKRHRKFAKLLGFRTTDEMLDWNDAPTTTHQMVIARLDEAIEREGK